MFPKTQLTDKKHCKLGVNRIFSCQASGIEFLSENNFDFNMWIKDGVPYLNIMDESVLRAKIDDQSTRQNANVDLIIDEENKLLVKESLDNLDNWLQNSNNKSFMVSFNREFLLIREAILLTKIKKQGILYHPFSLSD
jgi:hypothetical protein